MLATVDYTVAMPVVSLRFGSEETHRRLKQSARRRGVALSARAEQFVEEGLRMESHPLVVFRDGPSGRRPALVGGPDVSEVIGTVVGGDVPPSERVTRAADLLGLPERAVAAAVAYYAEFTDEVDAELEANAVAAERERSLWERGRDLLAR
jgi:hypothetical protein